MDDAIPSTSAAATGKATAAETANNNNNNKKIKFEDVELTIKRLQAQLPAIIYKTDSEDSDEESDLTPRCTCSLREVIDGDESTTTTTTTGRGDNKQDGGVTKSGDNTQQAPSIEINIVKDSDEELAEAQARERLKGKKKRRGKTAMKSIFDLEDDEVESGSSDDDLEPVPESDTVNESVIRVLVANERPSSSSSTINQQQSLQPTIESLQQFPAGDGVNDPAMFEMPKLPIYEALIDPNCPAMKYYETNRNQVTNFHVEALHNYFIPNVNGNWNQVKKIDVKNELNTTENTDKTEGSAVIKVENMVTEDDDQVTVETANSVVPRYNFLRFDKIPKQFSDFHFNYTNYLEKCQQRREQHQIKVKQELFSQSSVENDEVNHGHDTTSPLPTSSDHPNSIRLSSGCTDDDEMLAVEDPNSPHRVDHLPKNGFMSEEDNNDDDDMEEVIRNGHETATSHDESQHMETAPTNVSDRDTVPSPPPSPELEIGNNDLLPSFNELQEENLTGHKQPSDCEFSEWYQLVTGVSNDEQLTILPYVVID